MFCHNHPKRIAVVKCAQCGVPICDSCQTILKAKYFCPRCSSGDIPGIRVIPRRKPIKALLFSLFLPGFGQVYNGQLVKGTLIFFFSWLIVPWMYGVFDAYTTAEKINAHYVETRPSTLISFIFFVFVIGIILSGFRFLKLTSPESQTQKDLLTLAQAVEKYHEDHREYPLNFSQLYFTQPPYVDELYCDVDREGYHYSCDFSEKGYIITARPVTDISSGKPAFSVSTGGILKGDS